MCKHCVKCHAFGWWDGDFCCTIKMAIIESSPDGKFWTPIPDKFDANSCKDYDERENYDTDLYDYYNQYIDFLEDYYELPTIPDRELTLKELGYKNYEQKSTEI